MILNDYIILNGVENLNIRFAQKDDIPKIISIIKVAYEPIAKALSRPPGALLNTEKKINQAFQQNQLYVVCINNNNIIGTFSIKTVEQKIVKLSHFAISPQHQNQGIGSWVLNEIITKFEKEESKVQRIILEVYFKIPGLFQFYKKFNFSLIGEKEIKGERILILSLNLFQGNFT